MNIFIGLVKAYFVRNPQVVERLASYVIYGLIEHIAPSTVAGLAGLAGEASASPLAGVQGLGSTGGQGISR